jgi:hypothetical protein
MIPEFIKKWESGVKIVLGVKKNSKTNPVMHCIRTMYYKLMKKICTVEQLEHVTGFGLYDRSFLEILKSMNDPLPYLRGMVTEFESSIDTIDFVQPKRNSGKSSWNFMGLYDIAMRGITNYSKIPLRIATCLGGLCLILWFLTGIFGFIVFILFDISCTTLYLILWIIIGLLSMQFIFIGILGEYIVNINIRTMNHPTIVEEKRINFYNLEQEIH